MAKKEQYKRLTVLALEMSKGDNLYRAKRAFWHCTEKQMNELYGKSGKTRKEILDEYQEQSDTINEVITWIEEL